MESIVASEEDSLKRLPLATQRLTMWGPLLQRSAQGKGKEPLEHLNSSGMERPLSIMAAKVIQVVTMDEAHLQMPEGVETSITRAAAAAEMVA